MNSASSKVIVAGLLVLGACSSSSSSSSPETSTAKVESERTDVLERLDQSVQAVTQLGEKVPEEVALRTRCLVVVPSLVKAGVIVGGQSGKGFATCQTATGWSAPAPVTVAGGTFGAQLGAQATELVALVTTEKGMNALVSGNFRVGVDASATAGPVGTGRGSSTDISEGGDLVSYSRSKGLFAGANLDGSTIKVDEDASTALYGAKHEMHAILSGRFSPPSMPPVERFLGAVRTSFGSGRGAAISSIEK